MVAPSRGTYLTDHVTSMPRGVVFINDMTAKQLNGTRPVRPYAKKSWRRNRLPHLSHPFPCGPRSSSRTIPWLIPSPHTLFFYYYIDINFCKFINTRPGRVGLCVTPGVCAYAARTRVRRAYEILGTVCLREYLRPAYARTPRTPGVRLKMRGVGQP
jgi:hypothetical protein